MCVFKTYIQLQEELKELQKETVQANKNYNHELKLFQKETIIDSSHAERLKEKYDELQKTNDKVYTKENEIINTEKEIETYLIATNGMAIRYTHQNQGLTQPLIFEMDSNSLGEPKLKMTLEY
jgi:hypothetical protein